MRGISSRRWSSLCVTVCEQQHVRHVIQEWQARGFYTMSQIEDAGGSRYSINSTSGKPYDPHVMMLAVCAFENRSYQVALDRDSAVLSVCVW